MKEANIIKHKGELSLGAIKVDCYVLEDGTRVLSTAGMQRALGVIGNEPNQRSSGRLDEILSSKVVKATLSDDYDASSFSPILCLDGKKRISAFYATSLPDICELMLNVRDYAKEKGLELGERQKAVIAHADLLIRSLAKVGIIALIDEATGYQYEREKFELQTILKAFISPDILDWQETFHLGFYKEIFRLWDIPFIPQTIKRKPPFIGMLTNELIYKNLPKGSFVLRELKNKTPKTESGNYKVRLHQSLTPFGKEELKKVLYTVESLGVLSSNKKEFRRLVENRYGQKTLDFPNWDQIEKTKEEKPKLNISPTTFNNQLKGLLNVPPPKDDKSDEKEKSKPKRKKK